jgi:hypothetical protein
VQDAVPLETSPFKPNIIEKFWSAVCSMIIGSVANTSKLVGVLGSAFGEMITSDKWKQLVSHCAAIKRMDAGMLMKMMCCVAKAHTSKIIGHKQCSMEVIHVFWKYLADVAILADAPIAKLPMSMFAQHELHHKIDDEELDDMIFAEEKPDVARDTGNYNCIVKPQIRGDAVFQMKHGHLTGLNLLSGNHFMRDIDNHLNLYSSKMKDNMSTEMWLDGASNFGVSDQLCYAYDDDGTLSKSRTYKIVKKNATRKVKDLMWRMKHANLKMLKREYHTFADECRSTPKYAIRWDNIRDHCYKSLDKINGYVLDALNDGTSVMASLVQKKVLLRWESYKMTEGARGPKQEKEDITDPKMRNHLNLKRSKKDAPSVRMRPPILCRPGFEQIRLLFF